MKKGYRVLVEGDASELWIQDYDCRVCTEATVSVEPSSTAKKVLLTLDHIGGDRNVSCSVRRSKVKIIGVDCSQVDISDNSINPNNTWLWQDISGVIRHLRSMSSYHLGNLKKFLSDGERINQIDVSYRIANIEDVLRERNYTEENYQNEVKYHEEHGNQCAYSEKLILHDGLWILGSGIDDVENVWWNKYETEV